MRILEHPAFTQQIKIQHAGIQPTYSLS